MYWLKPTYSRCRKWDNAGDTGGRVFSTEADGVETLISGIGSGIRRGIWNALSGQVWLLGSEGSALLRYETDWGVSSGKQQRFKDGGWALQRRTGRKRGWAKDDGCRRGDSKEDRWRPEIASLASRDPIVGELGVCWNVSLARLPSRCDQETAEDGGQGESKKKGKGRGERRNVRDEYPPRYFKRFRSRPTWGA